MRFNKMIRDFLWNSKSTKIATFMLQANKENGGLGLIHIENKDQALKIQWVFKIQQNKTIRELAYNIMENPCGDLIWNIQLKAQDLRYISDRHGFWTDVLSIWCNIIHCTPNSGEQVKEQTIWFNSNIRIDDKPTYWKAWHSQGITQIKDLLSKENRFFTWTELTKEFHFSPPFTQYLGLMQAIPKKWKELIKLDSKIDYKNWYKEWEGLPSVTKVAYRLLNRNENVFEILVFRW